MNIKYCIVEKTVIDTSMLVIRVICQKNKFGYESLAVIFFKVFYYTVNNYLAQG